MNCTFVFKKCITLCAINFIETAAFLILIRITSEMKLYLLCFHLKTPVYQIVKVCKFQAVRFFTHFSNLQQFNVLQHKKAVVGSIT